MNRKISSNHGCKVITGYWFVCRNGEHRSLPEKTSPKMQNHCLCASLIAPHLVLSSHSTQNF